MSRTKTWPLRGNRFAIDRNYTSQFYSFMTQHVFMIATYSVLELYSFTYTIQLKLSVRTDRLSRASLFLTVCILCKSWMYC